MVSKDNQRESVAPTSLRVALSNLYPDINFFQEGQMNDASEVLGVIFNCLHRSFTPEPHMSDSTGTGSWDCTKTSKTSCIANSLFISSLWSSTNGYVCHLLKMASAVFPPEAVNTTTRCEDAVLKS